MQLPPGSLGILVLGIQPPCCKEGQATWRGSSGGKSIQCSWEPALTCPLPSESPECTSSSVRLGMWLQCRHTETWTHKGLHVGFDALWPVLTSYQFYFWICILHVKPDGTMEHELGTWSLHFLVALHLWDRSSAVHFPNQWLPCLPSLSACCLLWPQAGAWVQTQGGYPVMLQGTAWREPSPPWAGSHGT